MRLKEENDRLRASHEKCKKRETVEMVIEESIQRVTTYKDCMAEARKNCTENFFRLAFLAMGNPITGSREAELVAVCDSTPGLSNVCSPGMEKILNDRFPEFKDLGGRLETINITTKVVVDGRVDVKERWVTRAEINNDGEDLFNTLAQIRDKALEGDRKKLAFYPTQNDLSGTQMRKMLECLFRKTEIKCLVYVPGTNSKESIGGKYRREDRDIVAVLVKEEGKSYADLLKTVKDRITPGSISSRGIWTIREGRDGRMVVVVDRAQGESLTEKKTYN